MHAADDSQAPKKAAIPAPTRTCCTRPGKWTSTQTVREARKQRQHKQWLAEKKRTAIATYNDHVEQHGVFSGGLRTF